MGLAVGRAVGGRVGDRVGRAVGKLVGTTKPTIQAIRDRTHLNISNIQPIDPVALGLCKQSELDAAVQKAAKKKRDAEWRKKYPSLSRPKFVSGGLPGLGKKR